MRKYLNHKTLLIAISMILVRRGYTQITGTWEGVLHAKSVEIPLVFHLAKTDSGYAGSWDSPAQGAHNMQFNAVRYRGDSLICIYNAIGMRYAGQADSTGSVINGIYSQAGVSLALQLKKTSDDSNVKTYNHPQEPKPPFPYTSEDVTFENEKEHIKIAGTLTLPPDIRNPPIAVMITGSGPQDRNEEIFGHKPFWVIADYFARNGIGVLRTDDRGVGGTDAGDLRAATSADFATDVEAGVDYLRSEGYTNVGLIGHSEGGMIAPMIASERKDIKFVVMLAGLGIPGNRIIYEQTYLTNKSSGLSDSIARSAETTEKKLIDYIANYKGEHLKKDFGNVYDSLFSHSAAMMRDKNAVVTEMTSPWFIYFIRYNPTPALEKTKCPVLALNGTLDSQVPCEENLSAITAALKKGGNKKFEARAMPGLNHLFQHAKTGSANEYGTIEETISPEVLQMMKDWILQNAK